MVDFSSPKNSVFTATIQSRSDSLERSLGYVRSIADDFAKAFELGFFEPSKLIEPIRIASMMPDLILIEIRAYQCPSSLLRILWGMCEWARLTTMLPIEWLNVKQDGTVMDLTSTQLPLLTFSGHVGLEISRPAFIGLGEQMVVLIQFHMPLDKRGLALVESGLGVWNALLCGGLPPEGFKLGESAIGATSGYLITPTTYQWYVEGLAADSLCIDLLLRFLAAHAEEIALSCIDIEA